MEVDNDNRKNENLEEELKVGIKDDENVGDVS